MAYYCVHHIDLRNPLLKSATVFFIADDDSAAEEYYNKIVRKFSANNNPNVPDYQLYRMDLYKTEWTDAEYAEFCQQNKFLYHAFCKYDNRVPYPATPWHRMRSNVFVPDGWEDLRWANESIIPKQTL